NQEIQEIEDVSDIAVEIKETESVSVSNPNPEPENKETNETQIGRKSTSRSHIPFNVIMLNKDRQRMANPNSIKTVREMPVEEEKRDNDIKLEENQQVPEVREIHNTEESEEVYYAFPSKTLLKPPVIQEENSGWLDE